MDLGYFRIRADLGEGTTVLSLDGELDCFSAELVRARVDELAGGPPRRVVVDLEHLRFVDAGGLSALIALRSSLLDRGGTVEFLSASGLVRRVARLAEAEDALGLARA
jgi:anti-anti-sigma factor